MLFEIAICESGWWDLDPSNEAKVGLRRKLI